MEENNLEQLNAKVSDLEWEIEKRDKASIL